jgi:hypothetical protein
MSTRTRIFTSLLLSTTLVACGGGAEENNANNTNNTTGNNTTGNNTTGNNTTGNNTTGNNTTGNNTTGNNTTGNNTTGNNTTGNNTTGNNTTGNNTSGGWAAAGAACASTVETIFFEGDKGYMGCGQNAEGEGLFVSEDGGATWGASERRFEEVRVNDIRRGSDGVLYGAGLHQLDGYAVFSIDESGSSLEPVGLYEQSNQAFFKVGQGQNIAMTADGQMITDSLTGVTAAYKAADGEWTELEGLGEGFLTEDRDVFQVTTIVPHQNRFYAVGSVINDPAQIYLPSKEADATYHMVPLELQPSTRDGEMADLYIWDDGAMIAVGFDQSQRESLVYTLPAGGDAYDREAWSQIDLYDFGLDFESDANAVAVSGDTVVLVGEKIPSSQGGYIAISEDRGQTWTDITPETERGKIARMNEVWLWESGRIYAAGNGEGWIFTP